MENLTELELILLDLSRVWHFLGEKTKKFVAESVSGEENWQDVYTVLSEVNKDVLNNQ